MFKKEIKHVPKFDRQTIHVHSVLFRHHWITILGVEEDRGHWGMAEMRRREVHITKKRPSMQYLKCYYSLHNDPRPLNFFLKFPYANRFPMKEFYFKYFFNWGASRARFVPVTFFTFCKKFLIFTFSTVFGLSPQHSLALV